MRRFLLQRLSDPTGVSGTGIVAEGCIFGDGTTVVRWHGESPTTTVHSSLASVERIHLHGGATRILWCDQDHHGPRLATIILAGEPTRTEMVAPTCWLHDGWDGQNGAVDIHGVPLFVGQRVRLVGTHGEVKDDGEIVSLYAEDSGVRVGIIGADCGLCSYSDRNIKALEKTTKEALERNGGVKPGYVWKPAVRVEPKEAESNG